MCWDQHRLVFDVPLSAAAANGDVRSTWVHLALSVDHTAAMVYLNGQAITEFGVK